MLKKNKRVRFWVLLLGIPVVIGALIVGLALSTNVSRSGKVCDCSEAHSPIWLCRARLAK